MFKFDAINHAGHGMHGGMGSSNLFNPMMMHGGRMMSAILAGLLVYSIACWIFRCLGLYQMARKRGLEHAWFAWIPFLSDYILGELIDGKVTFGDSVEINDAEVYLPLLSLASCALLLLGRGSLLVQVLIMAITVFKAGALWRLFKLYQPESRVSYTILSLIFGSGFFIFALRNENVVDDPKPYKLYNTSNNQNLAFEDIYGDILENFKSEFQKEHTDYGDQVFNENLSEEKETLHNEYADNMDDIASDFNADPFETIQNYSENEEALQEEMKLENQIENALKNINDEIN